MKCSRGFLASLLIITLLPHLFCLSQTSLIPSNRVSGSKRSSVNRKEVIERHFESIQPTPRPHFVGAVPGIRLLDQRRHQAAKLQGRVHASQTAHPQAMTGNAALPGILLRPTLPSGALPTSVVTGDFNQDGHMDFVVANGLSNDLWIYLGNGDGTFQLPRIIPLSKGLSPVGLAVGDTRGNGKLDLVVAEADSSTIGVLLGNGDGTFGFEQTYTLPEPPESLVVEDFNHDGKADIAAVMVTTVTPATTTVPYIALLLGDGTGNFGTPIITSNWGFSSSAWNLASGDVNGDGLPDLLITGPGMENSQVFLNNGDGTFKAGAIVIRNGDDGLPMVLDGRLGDVNGDGCLDAVIADVNTMVWVALGDCAGNFATPTPVYMGDSNAAVRLADVNGDGHLDIVTAALPGLSPALGFLAGNTLNVALGDGKGNFGVARTYVGASQAYSIGVADFNGDGHPDFVTANNDSDTITVYPNDGSGSFGFPQGIYVGVLGQQTINSPATALSFADLNNDGKTDIFFLDFGLSGEYFATSLLNDGTGRFTGPINSDTGIQFQNYPLSDYRLGNFRNTGHLDMIAIGQDVAYSDGSEFILFLAGKGDGTFAKGTPLATTGADGILTTGDFNGDGKLDFVAVNGADTHTLTAFLGNGDGTFRATVPITFTDGNESSVRIYTGDFNSDGKPDVLVLTTGNGYWTTGTAVWEFDGNGDGTFQSGRKLFTDFQPFILADVNGDGRPDIARYDIMWPDGTTETLGPAKFTTYLGQLNGSFVQRSSYAPYSGIPNDNAVGFESGDPLASSLVSDLNGDGKPEEVAFQETGYGTSEKYAQILMGNGDGTFTPTYDIFPFYLYGYPLYAHDLDGDGIADMVELDSGTSALHVFKGGPAPALQISLQDTIVQGNSSCGWIFPDVASSSASTVTLWSSVPGVVLPSSVTIPANALSAQFCYMLAANYDWRQVFDINAQLNGSMATAYASDSYVFGFSETVSQSTVLPMYVGQSSAPITLSLTSSQGYSSKVKLSCQGMNPGDSCQFGSDTLDVSPAAVASTTVTFIIGASSAEYGDISSFTIVADDGNVIQRQTVGVFVAYLSVWVYPGTVFNAASPGTVTNQINITGIPPYALSCSGLPAGATCSFTGNPAAFPLTSYLNLGITVAAGVASGNYPFQVNVSSGSATNSTQLTLQVFAATATPTFSPAGGTYTTAQTVTISDSTSNATIYYAINTTPTTSSTMYSGQITISSTEVLEAIAVATGYTTSAVQSATYTINIPSNPTPVVSGISPAYTNAGGTTFPLTVNGLGFTAGSTVYWGTSALTTTYGSATQLTAQVPATDIATGGTTVAITVQTPTPGGGTSNSFQFEVNSASGSTTGPTFTSTTATVTAGSPASYPVTLPSSVESASVTCLNLPTGAACSYSATTNTVTITTTSSTPKGTYQITVVFTETVSGAATSWILLPILLLPLVYLRKKLAARGVWITACLGLVLLAAVAYTAGCGGGGTSTTTPPPQSHQVVSSGAVNITIQ